MSDWMEPHTLVLGSKVSDVLESLDEAVAVWGGHLERNASGAHLQIPVAVGLRQGFLEGDVTTEASGPATKLVFTPRASHYRLHRAAVVVLLFGALGGLLLVVAPLWPILFQLAPASIVLLLAAWFMVASRTKTRGPGDFFELVEKIDATPIEP